MKGKEKIRGYLQSVCIYFLDKLNNNAVYDMENVQIGEVYWCIMPLSKEGLLKVEIGHRIRPYVVLETFDDYFSAYPCSSKGSRKGNRNKQYYIDGKVYGNYKPSYVDTSKQVNMPYGNIQAYFYNLSSEDYENMINTSKQEIKTSKYDFSIGSIIARNHVYYFVFDIKDGFVYGHPLRTEHKGIENHKTAMFSFQNQQYLLDFTSVMHMEIDDEFEVVSTISKVQRTEVMKLKAKMLGQSQKTKTTTNLNVYFRYPIGALFYIGFQDCYFVYLFHREHKAYGYYYDAEGNEKYGYCSISFDYMQPLYEQWETEELKELITYSPCDQEIQSYLLTKIA